MPQYSLSQTTGEVRVFGHLSLIPTLSYVLIPFSNKHTIIKWLSSKGNRHKILQDYLFKKIDRLEVFIPQNAWPSDWTYTIQKEWLEPNGRMND